MSERLAPDDDELRERLEALHGETVEVHEHRLIEDVDGRPLAVGRETTRGVVVAPWTERNDDE